METGQAHVDHHRGRHVPWTLKDMLLVLLITVSLTVVFVLAVALITRILSLLDLQVALHNHPVVISAISGAAIYGFILLAIYIVILRRRHLPWSALGFRRPPLLPMALSPLIVTGQLGAIAVVNLIVISLVGDFQNPQIEAITGGGGFSWTSFLLMLLLVGVIAPIVEETVFRGMIYGWLRARLPIILAIVISAAIFAAVHVIPVLLPALFVVGIILAISYEWSGSLWVSILLHALQNSLTVTMIFVYLALGVPVVR